MATATLTLGSQNRWLADGSTTDWNFNFAGGYISTAHVFAYSLSTDTVPIRSDYIITDASFVSQYVLRISPAIPAGHTLVVYRDSRNNGLPLADFVDGGGINETDLDAIARQSIFVNQETLDSATTQFQTSQPELFDQFAQATLDQVNTITGGLTTGLAAETAARVAYEARLLSTAAGNGASRIGVEGGGNAQMYFTGIRNVLQFGADSTGAVDCTAAVQAAVDATPVGGKLVFPAGGTFRFDCSSVGYKVLITKSITVEAIGATFDIHASVQPRTWNAEQHNAIFRVSQVSGFTWIGGSVDGNRGDATPPWVGFIVGHGCSKVDISKLWVTDLDHADGAVRFDCLMPDRTTLVNQRDIKVHHCWFERCSYGPYVIGSVTNCEIYSNFIIDSDIQNPQSAHIRGWADQPTLKNYVATIAVYGFDTDRASTAGQQRGVKIHHNFIENCTQGPVCYNDLSAGKAAGVSLDCIDVDVSNNTLLNTLTGIHLNGWEYASACENKVTRLVSSNLSSYSGTAYISTTAGMSGALIEIATSGQRLLAANNSLDGNWPRDGSTDLSGSVTGILIGTATQAWGAGQRECTASVVSNIIDDCFTGVLDVGVKAAIVEANRFSGCKSFFTGNTFPRIGGVYSEGSFKGNIVNLIPYTGTKVGASFRGEWNITDNEFIGDPSGLFAYALTVLPGLSNVTVARNKFRNATQGVQLILNNTPTGAITSGTNTLTLSAPWVFTEGQTINVVGAGVAAATLTTTITTVAYNSGTGVQTLTLAANASTTVSTAAIGGATVNFLNNEFTGIGLPVEIAKDQFGTVRMDGNRFYVSTTVITFTAGSGTHGTYVGGSNIVTNGGWSNDSTASFPTDVGKRASQPASGTWNIGCTAYQSAPAAAGFIGWVCTTGGTPGTWKTFGAISA